MSEADRRRWENKHRDAHAGAPRPTLAWLGAIGATADGSPAALDLACGQGRHCRALVDAGYFVIAADIARTALRRLRDTEPAVCTRVARVQVDFDHWPFRAMAFDLVLQIDFLDRERFDDIKTSTKPGGHVLVDTFMRSGRSDTGRPSNPAYLLEPGELERVFADWRIVRAARFDGDTARAAILARRPRRP